MLIADRIGILRALYGAADAAFVGGTWIPLEDTTCSNQPGKESPSSSARRYRGCETPRRQSKPEGGGARVDDPAQLAMEIRALMQDPHLRMRRGAEARRAAESLAGGVARTLGGLHAVGLPPAERA